MPAKISSLKVSVSKAPQARDDSGSVREGSRTWLNVLENDLGSNAASIYSLSSDSTGASSAAGILAQAPVTSIETGLGATATIDLQDGLTGISYDTSASTGGPLDALNEGEEVTDAFSYVIQLGNGAFAIATVTVNVTGTNDAPTATGFTASVAEDLVLSGTLIGDDIDREDDPTTLRFEVTGQPADGTVAIVGNTYTFTPGESFQSLDDGETATVEFAYVAIDSRGLASAPATVTITVIGANDGIPVIDGYIANALVFRDTDEDGVHDTGEEFTFTNEQGVFDGLGGTGRTVVAPRIEENGANLSRDLSTGQAFTGMLSAPAGASVVTPLTTLVDALVNALTPDGSTATAEQIAAINDQLAAALGLPAGTQLTDLDPIAVIADSGSSASEVAAAFEVQKAAVQVANILAVVSGALQAADADDAASLATDALVAQFVGENGQVLAVNLSDAATLTSVVTAAADAGGVSAEVGGQAVAIGAALGNVNGVIDDTEVGGDGLAALAAVVTAQIVAQGELVTATEAAVSGGADLDSGDFSGAELTAKLDDAADDVAVIVPTVPDPEALGTPGRPQVDDGNRVSAGEVSDGIVVTVAYPGSSGVAAGDILRLLLANGEVANYTLTAADVPESGQTFTHSFMLAAGVLGEDGVKVLTAQFVSGDGTRESAQSLPAVITLDTVAQRPELAAVEGPIVSVLDAADGTQLVGTTELGSTVTATFSNGAVSFTRQAVVDGTSFTVDLTGADLAMLGEGYVSYSATAVDAAGNTSAASLTGQFFYTRQPIVDSTMRIDTGETAAQPEDDESVAVTASPGGGFVVRWVIAGGDEDAVAGLAFQRYAADGAKDGPIVVLQGLPASVLNGAADDGDVTSLDNGNFVLTYGVERDQADQFFVATRNVSGAPSEVSLGLIGVPTEIGNATLPGVIYELRGRNAANDGPQTVVLSPVGGHIEITQTILDLFSNDNRLTLVAKNLQVGQTLNLHVVTEQDQVIDLGAPLQAVPVTVAAFGTQAFVSTPGRAESFDVEQAFGANITYQIAVRPLVGGFNVDLSGITGAVVQPNGTILIGLAADAAGVVNVPQLLLDRLGDQDVRITLIANGLTAGSTFVATAYARPAIAAPEGIYVQLFDASGAPIGAPQPRIDGSHPADIDDDVEGGLGVSALADGGYIVRWAADEEGLAIQRFDAGGAKVGGVVILQGISAWAEDAEEVSYDLAPLDNGGYALTFALEHQTAGRGLSASLAPNADRAFNLVGEPSFVFVSSAPAETTFAVRGRNSANQIINVPVTVIDGEIPITQALLDNFSNDSRLSIIARSPNPGQVNLYVEVAGTQIVDLGADLLAFAGPTAVPGNNPIFLGAGGRLEYVDLDAYTAAAGATVRGNFTISALAPGETIRIDDIPGAVRGANGLILVNGVEADQNGVIRVPELLLERLGDQDVSISVAVFGLAANSTLISTSYGRPYAPAPEGVYVQMFDAEGLATTQPTVRIDGPGLRSETDDGTLGASATADGGVAVRWVYDADNDGEGDGIAVQKFNADGTAAGPVTVLDLPQSLLEADDVGFDVAALDNGGYALSYVLGLESHDRFASFVAAPNIANQATTIPLIGKVTFVAIANNGSLFTSPTFAIIGVGNDGMPTTVTVTPSNGGIEITQAILDQFGADNRLALQITNLQPGHDFSFFFEAAEDVVYDVAAHLADVEVSAVAVASANGGRAVLGHAFGRVEGFHIDSATFPAGATRGHFLVITPVEGGNTLDLAGLPGATLLPTGQVIIPVTPDGAGDIAVPQTILDQLGGGDASIQLVVQGLEVGSMLEGSVTVREGHLAPEGVFVMTFDADGNAVPSASELVGTLGDGNLIEGAGADFQLPTTASRLSESGAEPEAGGALELSTLETSTIDLGRSLASEFIASGEQSLGREHFERVPALEVEGSGRQDTFWPAMDFGAAASLDDLLASFGGPGGVKQDAGDFAPAGFGALDYANTPVFQLVSLQDADHRVL